jgi:hypothetical protein
MHSKEPRAIQQYYLSACSYNYISYSDWQLLRNAASIILISSEVYFFSPPYKLENIHLIIMSVTVNYVLDGLGS